MEVEKAEGASAAMIRRYCHNVCSSCCAAIVSIEVQKVVEVVRRVSKQGKQGKQSLLLGNHKAWH